jgi:apolipoprotein N-acyltransferase
MERLAERTQALGLLPALLLALVLGGLLALSQPPLAQFWLIFLVLPPLWWLASGARGGWAAAAIGWAAGTGFFGGALFWIWEPFQVDPDLHGFLAPFAVAGMAGGLALFWAAAFGIARAIARPGLAGALAFACLLAAAEIARSYVLTGFPWALPGYVWVATPVIQTTALFGIHGLSILTLLLAALPAAPMPRIGRAGGLIAVLAAIGLAWAWGAARLAGPAPERETPYLVRIVQPNAPQHLKWHPDHQAEFFRRHLEMTAAEGEHGRPDIIVWSETAVPFLLGQAPQYEALIAEAARGAPVILGIMRAEITPDEERWFNSLAILGPGGETLGVYDKHHLVPFGEFIPLQSIVQRLGGPTIQTLTRGGFTPGEGPQIMGTAEIPAFLPLICYEAIFPQHLWAPQGRPEWLVQVTNDAWFGTLSGPFQHHAQNRVRAIEQGLPLVRVANTGISAIVDPMGREIVAIPLGETGFADALLPGPLPPTTFAGMGNRPAFLILIFVFLLTFINFRGGHQPVSRP